MKNFPTKQRIPLPLICRVASWANLKSEDAFWAVAKRTELSYSDPCHVGSEHWQAVKSGISSGWPTWSRVLPAPLGRC